MPDAPQGPEHERARSQAQLDEERRRYRARRSLEAAWERRIGALAAFLDSVAPGPQAPEPPLGATVPGHGAARRRQPPR